MFDVVSEHYMAIRQINGIMSAL